MDINDKLKIQMRRRIDGNGKEYFFAITDVPLDVSLQETVIHVFPTKEGADLVIKFHDPERANRVKRRAG